MAGGAAGKVLHAANMPTHGDVRRLSRQVAALTSEIRTLSATQREATAAQGYQHVDADLPAEEDHELAP
jgi:hypothetical protein